MAKFIDSNGFLYFWQFLKTYFAKLSDIPTKISDLVNDSNFITTIQKNGVDLISDNHTVDIEVPIKTSDLLNDSDYVVDASYVHTDYNFSTTERNKLSGIDAGAEVNVIEEIYINGLPLTPENKAVNINIPTVPTNVSSFVNDINYQTATDVSTSIVEAIGQITGIDYSIVQSLPVAGLKGTIYLVPNSGVGQNIYDEYIYVSNTWEKIGTTDIDLSGYWNTSNLVSITNLEIDDIVDI